MEKRPNRKDYVDEKTKVQLIADLELHIDYLEKKLLNPTPTNEGAKTAEGMNYKDQVSDETIKKIALETYFTTEGQSGFATGFLKCRSILLPILAEKDKELRSKDTELKKYDVRNGFLKEQISQLKATKSELPTDEEIGEWVCKEFKVDGLDADEDVRTQYGYLPAYFKSFAVWVRSKFPQSELPSDLIQEAKMMLELAISSLDRAGYDTEHYLKTVNKIKSLPQSDGQSDEICEHCGKDKDKHTVATRLCPDRVKHFKSLPQSDGQRYGEAEELLKEYNRVTSSTICSFKKGTAGYNELNQIRDKTKSFLTQEPKQDGQRYGEILYLNIRQVISDEYDKKTMDTNYNFITRFARAVSKHIQTLQSKEQEPKESSSTPKMGTKEFNDVCSTYFSGKPKGSEECACERCEDIYRVDVYKCGKCHLKVRT